MIVAFRRHTLLPLDDCLYALRPTIPLSDPLVAPSVPAASWDQAAAGDRGRQGAQEEVKSYPIGFFHIDVAEIQTAEGKLYLFVAIDRTSKFAFVQLVESTNRVTASAFLLALIAVVPYKIHTILTDNGHRFRFPLR